MLVIADKLRSGAEKRIAAWLRSWDQEYRIPGVAIMNCFAGGQEVDLVVITPHTTVAGEIKGIAPEATGGVLHCTTNTRWTVPGYAGDPVGVRGSDTTPYDQVRDAVFKMKAAIRQVGGSAFVTGLVLVVPPRESTMRLEKKSAPPQGCDVLLCDTPNPLRAWFHRAHHRSAVVWTAEQAYALIEALEFGDRITVTELAEEGFPLESTPLPDTPAAPVKPIPRPPVPAARPVTPTPPPPAPPDEPAPHVPRPEPQPIPEPSPEVAPAASGDRRRGHFQTAAAFAAIALAAALLWLWSHVRGDEPEPREIGTDQQISSAEPAPPPAAGLPPAAPAPAPPVVGKCFPFQPDC
ncbi:nuclease-related domain-containing protein [Nocardia sp. X0981]